MKIRKKEPSIGILGKIINSFSSSKQDTYSCDFINQLFPIGKVEIFFDNDDHSNHLGLKWERTCVGRVPVGIDSADEDFNTIGKTGGDKEMQSHSHKLNNPGLYLYGGSSNRNVGGTAAWYGTEAVGITTTFTGEGNSGNLQPYEVMAFWKRVE